MSLLLPIISLFVALTMSMIITRVATIALRFTGLSQESAKFQARSAFTGVGFTTSEAESIVNHPVRRRIVMWLMLLGNVGIATVIATLMVTMMRADDSESWFTSLLILAAGLAILWLLAKSRWVERHMNRLIAQALRRFTHLDVRDYVELLKLASGFTVTELLVESGDWIADKTLVDLGLAREGVLVLGIRRHDGRYLGAPSGATMIEAGDALVIYGLLDRLEELDGRCKGAEGDQAHLTAARDYDQYLAEVDKEDDSVVGSAD